MVALGSRAKRLVDDVALRLLRRTTLIFLQESSDGL